MEKEKTTNQKLLASLRTFLETYHYTARVMYSDSLPNAPWRRVTLSIRPIKGQQASALKYGSFVVSNGAINFLNQFKGSLYKPARRRQFYNRERSSSPKPKEYYLDVIVYWVIKNSWENSFKNGRTT